MEGEDCVLVEEQGAGWGEENWSPSLRSGGSLSGEQEAGDGPEFGPFCRACGAGTQDIVSAPGFTEELYSQCAEQAAL